MKEKINYWLQFTESKLLDLYYELGFHQDEIDIEFAFDDTLIFSRKEYFKADRWACFRLVITPYNVKSCDYYISKLIEKEGYSEIPEQDSFISLNTEELTKKLQAFMPTINDNYELEKVQYEIQCIQAQITSSQSYKRLIEKRIEELENLKIEQNNTTDKISKWEEELNKLREKEQQLLSAAALNNNNC